MRSSVGDGATTEATCDPQAPLCRNRSRPLQLLRQLPELRLLRRELPLHDVDVGLESYHPVPCASGLSGDFSGRCGFSSPSFFAPIANRQCRDAKLFGCCCLSSSALCFDKCQYFGFLLVGVAFAFGCFLRGGLCGFCGFLSRWHDGGRLYGTVGMSRKVLESVWELKSGGKRRLHMINAGI